MSTTPDRPKNADLPPAHASSSRYGYFVVQASSRRTDDGADLSGVMEDLTTGEKQAFGSAADIARLMVAWAGEVEQTPSGASNEPSRITRTSS
jgi:hypothetical protein